jgi:diguanylate cyclase (GGDEF)-like protein
MNRDDTQAMTIRNASHGLNVLPSLPVHTAIGAVSGFFILHPLAMLIHRAFMVPGNLGWDIPSLLFTPLHIAMGLSFAVLGAVVGFSHWLYGSRIVRLYETAKALSATDPVTGLGNRRYFSEKLRREVSRARRYSRDLSLVMVDIDDFKGYNDRYGHQDGDRLLKSFAETMGGVLRRSDVAARFGGDEFTIIAVESGAEESGRLAERLRKEVERRAVSSEDADLGKKVTISAGVAHMDNRIGNAESLLQAADRALYRAKLEGRNRVHVRQDTFLE